MWLLDSNLSISQPFAFKLLGTLCQNVVFKKNFINMIILKIKYLSKHSDQHYGYNFIADNKRGKTQEKKFQLFIGPASWLFQSTYWSRQLLCISTPGVLLRDKGFLVGLHPSCQDVLPILQSSQWALQLSVMHLQWSRYSNFSSG